MQILPSYPAPGQDPGGLELAPFRGVRYAQDRVSGLAEVTSPPYDVIFEDKEDQLMAADPHNVVRLILPRPRPGRPGEEYHDAAMTLAHWLDEQILVTDRDPALYVYEQRTVAGRDAGALQRGLIGAVRLTQPQDRIVLPHEGVYPGPVAGRLALMEAAQANLEPIFLLYDGGPGSAAIRLSAQATAGQAVLSARTSDGIEHTLWALPDPAAHAAIAADLAPRQALIADGNHRYAAYRQLQADRHAAGDGPGPWDYGLALLVDNTAFPPTIGAIHRVIPGLDPDEAVERAKAAFTVRPLPGGPAGLPAALDTLAAAGRDGTAFLVAGAGQLYLLYEPDPVRLEAAMPAGKSAAWRRLPSAALQELLLGELWQITDDERTVQVVHHDAARAVAQASQAGGTAVLVNALSAADVYEVAAAGERLPRKSTSFAPKPRTGLVLRSFAED